MGVIVSALALSGVVLAAGQGVTIQERAHYYAYDCTDPFPYC